LAAAKSLKLTPPINKPTGGMMTSPTKEETILPKAAPMMTPTAKVDHVALHGKFFELTSNAHNNIPFKF
jgi:hypothetical protein